MEGKEVVALIDGNPHFGLHVDNGTLLLPAAGCCVHVGLAYTSLLQTLPAHFSRNGTTLDQKKRVVSVTFKLADSRGGSIGSTAQKTTPWVRIDCAQLGTPPALQTRDVQCVISGTHAYFPSIILKQTEPFPVTVLACISRIV